MWAAGDSTPTTKLQLEIVQPVDYVTEIAETVANGAGEPVGQSSASDSVVNGSATEIESGLQRLQLTRGGPNFQVTVVVELH